MISSVFTRALKRALVFVGGVCATIYGSLHINNTKADEMLYLGIIMLGCYLALEGALGERIKSCGKRGG